METLENRIEKLEKRDKKLYGQLRNIQNELDQMNQQTKISQPQVPETSVDKVNYLTEINEQMFQQNVRLRAFIEDCIYDQTIPSHEKYYEVLREY